ncbi:MAG: TetR/AcrR family transcriptional regulator [Treponema sp.]|nr:TetR/AcrR family transcriptional regulator [Treponema sp.]
MAIIVEHDKRRKEILQKSLDVFVEEGYEDVTFQKIADRCGITRTTLYIYFKNKHEIFLGSIKELMSSLETTILLFINDENLTDEIKLRKILSCIIDKCEDNKKLFIIILGYLLQLKKSGVDTNQRVRRRVVRLKHHLSTVLIHGIQNGEFRATNVKDMNELLYGLIESAIFRLTILNQERIADIRETIDLAIDGFLK